MFKGHPKGLFALALANTGERFGYYTMLAIFVLYLQAKFGFDGTLAGQIYGGFLGAVYFMPLIGGFLADRLGYGRMVTLGIVVMFLGYALLAVPLAGTGAMVLMFAALLAISIGTGLFKGNLQVMVGNLYDAPEYRDKRDNAFSIFYMAINIGAMFAPSAATAIVNWRLAASNFIYNAQIPSLSHQYVNGTITPEGLADLTRLAAEQPAGITDLTAFAPQYIEALSGAYNAGFAVACVSLVVSIAIYLSCRAWFKHADVTAKQQAAAQAAKGEKPVELTREQTRSRVVALCLVFVVVIFFWMSFHQNGLTLTFFARDYTANSVTGIERIGFNILNLALIVIGVYSLFSIFQSQKARGKAISAGVFALAVAGLILNYMSQPAELGIQAPLFQQFNPFFVVILTPVSVAIFSALAKRKKEPTTPRKIGMGMIIAALGFVVMAVASFGLMSPAALEGVGGVSPTLVSPNWLIGTYLVLTFGELLLSPMGISFVSKVAPPKYKGAMMGLWFAATAIGNYLTGVIAGIWGTGMELWMVWAVLIAVCLLSAVFIFSIIKRLDKATANV
jgi:POT family proton-dependent oligopeptide transporter